jgi:hypothetical protein
MEELYNVVGFIYIYILRVVIHFVMCAGCLESNASIFLSLHQISCQNETHKIQLRMCTVLLYLFFTHSVPLGQCNTASTKQYFWTFQFRIFSFLGLEMYPTLIPCDRTGKKLLLSLSYRNSNWSHASSFALHVKHKVTQHPSNTQFCNPNCSSVTVTS